MSDFAPPQINQMDVLPVTVCTFRPTSGHSTLVKESKKQRLMEQNPVSDDGEVLVFVLLLFV